MPTAQKQEQTEKVKASLVCQFVDEYASAIVEARISAEHTASEGWQHLYCNERAEEQRIKRDLCRELEGMSKLLSIAGPTEDDEKQVGEIKKRLSGLRERIEAFDLHTVGPVKEPVINCGKIIDRYRSEARREEADAPLVNSGLMKVMDEAISEADKAEWNNERGLVEITAPAAS